MGQVCRGFEKQEVKYRNMYHPVLKMKANGAPVISGCELDVIGERLVTDFLQEPPIEPREIDVDRFANRYLHMGLDYKYLSHCGVYLGTTIFTSSDKIPIYAPEENRAKYIHVDAHTIIIDETLLGEEQEHRYRFTLGHEASHGVLHEQFFIRKEGTSSFYEEEAVGIRCRSDSYELREKSSVKWTDLRRVEWQANRLSAAILMPKSMVAIIVARNPLRGDFMRQLDLVHAMSNQFNVSLEAAYYRLVDLGFVDKEYNLTSRQLFVGDFTVCPADTG